MRKKIRGRLTLIFIISLFTFPVIAAWYLVFFTDFKISNKGSEHGILINPIVKLNNTLLIEKYSLEEKSLEGKWNLVFLVQNKCNQNCEFNLYKLRQIRLALGKDMDKVQRIVFIKTDKDLSEQQEKNFTGQLTIPDQATKDIFIKTFETYKNLDYNSIYLIDPYLNLIMQYPQNTNPSGIIKDLERLIRISK